MRAFIYCVLVTGGRNYANPAKVYSWLDAITFLCGGDIMLMHGGATGLDSCAEAWAKDREQISVRIPAQWGRYGQKAGTKRNAEMGAISQAHFVVAFQGGRGTLNMLGIAQSVMLDPKPHIILPDGEFWK